MGKLLEQKMNNFYVNLRLKMRKTEGNCISLLKVPIVIILLLYLNYFLH